MNSTHLTQNNLINIIYRYFELEKKLGTFVFFLNNVSFIDDDSMIVIVKLS